MEVLTIDQMCCIQSGQDNTLLADTLCALWGAGRLLEILAYSNPISAAIAFGVDLACITYALGSVGFRIERALTD